MLKVTEPSPLRGSSGVRQKGDRDGAGGLVLRTVRED
jgi:hypothetical protein